jgi:hypothetical protein
MSSHKPRELLIVRCRDNLKWYAGLIGKTVPFLAVEGKEYRSMQPEGYINYVSCDDAIIVERGSDGGRS